MASTGVPLGIFARREQRGSEESGLRRISYPRFQGGTRTRPRSNRQKRKPVVGEHALLQWKLRPTEQKPIPHRHAPQSEAGFGMTA
jgi:hypothetical protein